MNIQQLEYIMAVDTHRHFARAADACFVTQPTLSMMIQKLEEELGVKLFDRSRHPVVPTAIGRKVIDQARLALNCINKVREIVEDEKGSLQGTFRLGIIPTIAPYLLPVLLPGFTRNYPGIRLVISEMVTSQTISDLGQGLIDGAILATPLNEQGLAEHPLFYERFFAYVSEREAGYQKELLEPGDIDASRLWLLEEGHCFRSQILHYCALRNNVPAREDDFVYEAGSIETLVRMVDCHGGMTIIPEMALRYLRPGQRGKLRPFADPVPVREVSLVTRNDFIRRRVIEAFRQEALSALPGAMTNSAIKLRVVEI